MRSKFLARYRKQASRLHSRALATFSDVGGGLGGAGWFELFLGRSPITFLLQQSISISHVPLVFELFGLLQIFVRHSQSRLTRVLDDGLYLGVSPPITDLGPGLAAT